ncbi:lysophosphatidic acid receptor 4-like [Gigantopelta aegis]|uniref:lysophosphatidic acid receptor 4-like n=1 Tax=Gigantopelta aegis TaxID=1735272 RepID=UPI001B88CAD8|nr:lysophosphatidic acid receptor 4-like [Gigantopelta aegis]
MTLDGKTTGMFDIITNETNLLNGTDSLTESNETDPTTSIYSGGPGTAYWVCSVITVAIGLVGNSLMFPLLANAKFSLLSYPVYLRFMAVSDSAVLIMFGINLSLRFFNSFHIIGNHVAACSAWMFTRNIVMLLSPWLVVGLTLDRFYCVVFPMKRERLCTKRKATIVCLSLSVISAALSFPFVNGVYAVEGSNTCFVKNHLVTYFATLRLLVNSILPCLLILVFNIVTGIHIQRSANFRKRFTSTSSGSKENKQDKSLRPLMLISILAFVTILPSAIIECALGILLVTKSDFESVLLLIKLLPPFGVLYLINFGQNFYILMACSANYRKIMKSKMKCKKVSTQNGNVTVSKIPVQVSNFVGSKTDETESSARPSLQTSSTSVTSPAADSKFG